VTASLDIDALRKWIGRTESAEDEITAERTRAFTATLTGDLSVPAKGDPAPLAFHWCLAPRLSALADADIDGHPKRGDFLPPVPLPRRMWAGGELELLAPLRVGDRVKRQSRIDGVELKVGRTGPLCFVTVAHEFSASGVTCIRERHDIVYRDKATAETVKPAAPPVVAKSFAAEQVIDPSPILLFRYSALTFNSHRIHYDVDYAMHEEGYAGLVVHGPLQATLLLHHAAAIAGRPPGRFSYRGLAPLTHGEMLRVRSTPFKDGTIECWTSSETVPVAMTAQAFW
jgi:3-methylfumaryl-CoA hydratase